MCNATVTRAASAAVCVVNRFVTIVTGATTAVAADTTNTAAVAGSVSKLEHEHHQLLVACASARQHASNQLLRCQHALDVARSILDHRHDVEPAVWRQQLLLVHVRKVRQCVRVTCTLHLNNSNAITTQTPPNTQPISLRQMAAVDRAPRDRRRRPPTLSTIRDRAFLKPLTARRVD
jgi:hypothetical protein